MLADFVFHHIGYATKSIKETAKTFLLLGYIQTEIITDKLQKVQIVFLSKKDSPLIELVEPLGDNSPVLNIITKNGVTPYHICYEVDDINLAIVNLRKHGFISLFNPVPASAFSNRLICYVYSKETGLIELLNI